MIVHCIGLDWLDWIIAIINMVACMDACEFLLYMTFVIWNASAMLGF